MDFKPSVFFEALTSPAFIEGVKITITLTVVAMAFGLALGLLVALLRASPWAPSIRFRCARKPAAAKDEMIAHVQAM